MFFFWTPGRSIWWELAAHGFEWVGPTGGRTGVHKSFNRQTERAHTVSEGSLLLAGSDGSALLVGERRYMLSSRFTTQAWGLTFYPTVLGLTPSDGKPSSRAGEPDQIPQNTNSSSVTLQCEWGTWWQKKWASSHCIQTGGLDRHFTGARLRQPARGAPTAFNQGNLWLLFDFSVLSKLEFEEGGCDGFNFLWNMDMFDEEGLMGFFGMEPIPPDIAFESIWIP